MSVFGSKLRSWVIFFRGASPSSRFCWCLAIWMHCEQLRIVSKNSTWRLSRETLRKTNASRWRPLQMSLVHPWQMASCSCNTPCCGALGQKGGWKCRGAYGEEQNLACEKDPNKKSTLPKLSKMEPEKWISGRGDSFREPSFSGSMLVSGG